MMKIGQLSGKLWLFSTYHKIGKPYSLDYCSLMTLKPTKCCLIHFYPPRIVCQMKVMILGLWIMKIGQLSGKLWQLQDLAIL